MKLITPILILTLCGVSHASEKPNILFFFVDDLGRHASIYADPGNLHNLANDPTALSDLKSLRARLEALMQETSDPRLTDAFDKPPYVADPATLPERNPRSRKNRR